MDQQQQLMNPYMGQTLNNRNMFIKKVNIFAIFQSIMNLFFYGFAKYGPLLLVFIIAFLSILHLIIVIYTIFHDNLSQDEDTIIKDTLKYKYLQYVKYIHCKIKFSKDNNEDKDNECENNNEPLSFMIFVINSLTSVLIYSYLILSIGLIFIAIILYLIPIAKIFISDVDFDDEKLTPEYIKSLFSIDMFVGIIIAIILQSVHKALYSSNIHPILLNIKEAHDSLDDFILNEIPKNLNEDIKNGLKTALNNYDQDNLKSFEDIKKITYEETKDNLLQQITITSNNKFYSYAITYFILYMHIYDKIPDTNDRNKDVIKYFFNRKDSKDLKETSYISFFVDKKGMSLIDKTSYLQYDIPSEVLKEVDKNIDEVNFRLRQCPDFGNISTNFITHALIVCVVSVIAFVLHFKLFSSNISPEESEKIKQIPYLSKFLKSH